MRTRRLTRRKALYVMAAAGAAVWPFASAAAGARAGGMVSASADAGGTVSAGDALREPATGGPVYRWRGSALGVRASIVLTGEDARRGAGLRRGWEAELGRLDSIFNLYRHGSTLRTLNRHGGIDAPPLELVELLAACRGLHRLTGGVFDPTVQPLWELYARSFTAASGTVAGDGRDRPHQSAGARIDAGPGLAARERALRCVGLERVTIESARIEFARAGMGITLNGIAQGYVTDRVTEWLLGAGVANALVDVGEIRALGHPPNRDHWRIGRAETQDATPYSEPVELASGAVATSSPAGYRFGGHRRHHHLFDRRTGASASRASTVTVVAPTATLADGLSTAFAMMTPARVREIAAAIPGVTAYFDPASA